MTSDGRGTTRKAWKAFQVEYDEVIRRSERLCCYCLTDQQVQVLLSMCDYVKWPTRWVSNDVTVSRDFTEEFSSQMEKQLMSGCNDENTPVQYRYSISGVLQRSFNGGVSWSDCAEYDPRNYSTEFPPLAGDDGAEKQCVAAVGAVALIKEQVGDQLTDGMSRTSLTDLIKTWVTTFVQTSNPFIALVTVITNLVFGLVITTLRAALTEGAYTALECAIYCNIGTDASVTQEQHDAMRAQILTDVSGIAGVFFEHLIYLLGVRGTQNLVRAGGVATATCDCGCGGECALDFHVDQGTLISNDGATIVVSSGFSSGEYVVGIARSAYGVCCGYQGHSVVDGSITGFQTWVTCADDVSHFGTIPSGTNVYYLVFASSNPFTVSVIFSDQIS